jgi:hypothetical protein
MLWELMVCGEFGTRSVTKERNRVYSGLIKGYGGVGPLTNSLDKERVHIR